MTCYENLRKPVDAEKKIVFKKLESYFRALEEDKVDEYHSKRGR
jgi:hypothetical protein